MFVVEVLFDLAVHANHHELGPSLDLAAGEDSGVVERDLHTVLAVGEVHLVEHAADLCDEGERLERHLLVPCADVHVDHDFPVDPPLDPLAQVGDGLGAVALHDGVFRLLRLRLLHGHAEAALRLLLRRQVHPVARLHDVLKNEVLLLVFPFAGEFALLGFLA